MSKAALQSKTIIAASVGLLASIGEAVGVPAGAIDPGSVTDAVMTLVTVGSLVMAIWGRTVADKPITGVVTPVAPPPPADPTLPGTPLSR
jgi:hypothetical protein